MANTENRKRIEIVSCVENNIELSVWSLKLGWIDIDSTKDGYLKLYREDVVVHLDFHAIIYEDTSRIDEIVYYIDAETFGIEIYKVTK
jgi:hypothetical protein